MDDRPVKEAALRGDEENVGPRAQMIRRRLAAEQGFTLVELLVTCVVSIAVIGATYSLLDSSRYVTARDVARDQVVARTDVGLRSMTQELRNAYQVVGPLRSTSPTPDASNNQTSNYLDVLVRLVSSGTTTSYRVLFDCGVSSPTQTGRYACYRYQSAVTASQAAGVHPSGVTGKLVVDGLTNTLTPTTCSTTGRAFCLSYPTSSATKPTGGTLTADAAAADTIKRGGDSANVQIADGFYMPNLDIGL